MKLKNKIKKGFTLVELVVVIAVIAILSAVSVGAYVGVIESARQSTYLQTAQSNLTEYLTENKAKLEENSYIFISEDDTNVAWFKYENNKLNKLSEEPDVSDIDYAYPLDNSKLDYLTEGVTLYRPIVKSVVTKLNSYLYEASATTYEKLADAGKRLTDEQVDIINNRETGYKFAYSLTNNKVFIADETLTDLLYCDSSSVTSVPSDKKVVVATNINSGEDLVNFSNATNANKGSTGSYAPTDDNIFMKGNPVVIVNLNNNIVMSDSKFVPIADWGFDYHLTSTYPIHILLNGKNHKISKLNNILTGSIALGSSIKDLKIEFSIGSSTNYLTESYFEYNRNSGEYYHCGLISTGIVYSSNSTINSEHTVHVDNVNIGGKVYLKKTTNSKLNLIGCMFGFVRGTNTNSTANVLEATNYSIFDSDNDYFECKSSSTLSLIIANANTNRLSFDKCYGIPSDLQALATRNSNIITLDASNITCNVYGLKDENNSAYQTDFPYIGTYE